MSHASYKGLVVFDCDGTLIREKTVCDLIAAQIGKSERMDWLEQNAGAQTAIGSSSRNPTVIEAREEMAGWYFDSGRTAVESFLPSVVWAKGVHDGIKSLVEAGFLVAISSMTWKFGVGIITSDLGINEFTGTDLDWDSGEITHLFPEEKAEFLEHLVEKYEIPSDRVFAVGDSGGDAEMLKAAGRGFFVGTNDPEIAGIIHLPDAGIDTIAQRIIHN